MQQIITYFATPVLATIPVTIVLCRLRLAYKKRVSFGTMLFSAFVTTSLWLVLMSWGDWFSKDFWSTSIPHKGYPHWPFDLLKDSGFIMALSTLPALCIVAYYQKHGRRNEAHAA